MARIFLLLLLLMALAAPPAEAADLEAVLGRTELEIRSAPGPVVPGLSEAMLEERLERLGYRRDARPERHPGTWTREGSTFRIHRRAFRHAGRRERARLLVVDVRGGRVAAVRTDGGRDLDADDGAAVLEPEVLATSWEGGRAPRLPVDLDALPEHVWRPVLALEDHRFFQHAGVSGRSLARAALKNLQAGGVAEGGSTLTMQLVKNRDLTPRRSLDRKASEAVRALALEATYTKREILQAYLNTVYFGHVDGVGIYGLGRAARAWFGKEARDLQVHEAALLAALLKGPSAYHPIRNRDAARERRDHALTRMAELGWLDDATAAEARARPLGIRTVSSPREAPAALLSRIRHTVEDDAARRLERGLGFTVDTTLDPVVQDRVEAEVADWLGKLRTWNPRLKGAPLQAAVAIMDADTGAVLAWVGADPAAASDAFDRVRRARRQPGSTVKPLILLEAYDDCGPHDPIRPSTLLPDTPLEVDGWAPRNADRRFLGAVSAHEALVASRNVPLARLGLHCGLEAVAERFEDAGLSLPEPVPPSSLLGSVEARPVDLLRAYSAFSGDLGRTVEPRVVARIARANGTRTGGERVRRDRLAGPGAAWIVGEALEDVVSRGTGRKAALGRGYVAIVARGKTGTSSEGRDAWFAGVAGGRVAVVWVGLDEGRLGLSGGEAAAPLWARIMRAALDAGARDTPERPRRVRTCRVDPATGLAPGVLGDGDAARVPCLRGAGPPRNQPWRTDRPDILPAEP
jgi:penicillin-binding protein 1B